MMTDTIKEPKRRKQRAPKPSKPPLETREEYLARIELARQEREAEELREASAEDLRQRVYENVLALKDPTLRDGETPEELITLIEKPLDEMLRRLDAAPDPDELEELRKDAAIVEELSKDGYDVGDGKKLLKDIEIARGYVLELCGDRDVEIWAQPNALGLLRPFLKAIEPHLPHGSDARDQLHELQRWFERGGGKL
jgi:hypothetical protein